MFGIGEGELVLIALFAFMIFGPDKLPGMGRTLGRALRQFRSAQEGFTEVVQTNIVDPAAEAMSDNPKRPTRNRAAELEEDADLDLPEGEARPKRAETFAERKKRLAAEKAAREAAEREAAEAEAAAAPAEAAEDGDVAASEPAEAAPAQPVPAVASDAQPVKPSLTDLYAMRPSTQPRSAAPAGESREASEASEGVGRQADEVLPNESDAAKDAEKEA